MLKFIYSEKATKVCEIFTLLLSYIVPVKSKAKILQNFVAFSEYMNFNTQDKHFSFFESPCQIGLNSGTANLYVQRTLIIYIFAFFRSLATLSCSSACMVTNSHLLDRIFLRLL